MYVLSHFCCVRLFAPLSMEFSRQEYWSGQPFPSPGDLPDPGMESGSPGSPTCGQILPHQGSPKESEEGLLVNLDCYSKYHKLDQKSNIKMSRDLVSCESSLLGLQMITLQPCSSLLCMCASLMSLPLLLVSPIELVPHLFDVTHLHYLSKGHISKYSFIRGQVFNI